MKSAPDKIYLNKYMFKTGMLYKSQCPVTPDIEYIRKDALLELLQGMIRSCETKNGFPAGTLSAVRIETLEAVISRIEEICKEEGK